MSLQEFAPGVARLPVLFVNVYFVDVPGGWVLVDTGLPGFAGKIRQAAQERYGDTPPSAIVLTHGHFDHASNACILAEAWNVPIYAHRLEIPYLNGQSHYPPRDPTVGGAIAFLSRAMPDKSLNVGPNLRALPGEIDSEIPELPGWKIIFTPGHSPGHVSLFHAESGVLLAGDALATTNIDSWIGLTTLKPELARAGTPFNCDWKATRHSIERLAELRPQAIGAGHGVPQNGEHLATDLREFAGSFLPPQHGRYIPEPALTDETGVLAVPAPAPDPFPKIALAIGMAVLLISCWNRKKAR